VAEDRLRAHRLGDDPVHKAAGIGVGDPLAPSGEQKHLGLGGAGFDLLGQLPPGHPGHSKVGDDQIRGLCLEARERVGSGDGIRDLVTRRLEQIREGAKQPRVIIHEKNLPGLLGHARLHRALGRDQVEPTLR
jgi:hypothetical protein